MSKAILTVHGYLTDKHDFGRLYDFLDCYDEVYAVEIPGHNGKVDMRKFTVSSTFSVLLNAYDRLKALYDSVDAVGFSMGGALTTWLCAVRSVRRAVVFAPANKYFNFKMPLNAVEFYGGKSIEAYRSTDGSIGKKAAAVGSALAPYGENINITGKVARSRTLKYFTPRNGLVFRNIIKQCNTMIEAMSPIKTPLLALWGKLDELVPQKSVEYISKHFSDSRVKIYPDVGHAMLYSNLDHLFIKEAMDFLTDGHFDKQICPRETSDN